MLKKVFLVFLFSPLIIVVGLVMVDLILVSPIETVDITLPLAKAVQAQSTLQAEKMSTGLASPEAIAIDEFGTVFLGTADGFIWQRKPDQIEFSRLANVGGYPIGIVVDEEKSHLYIANYPIGLQRVGYDGAVETLLTSIEGRAIGFADDIELSRDGFVYLTDASAKYNPKTHSESDPIVLWDFLEGQANGRLIRYDTRTGEAAVLNDNLYFPSGLSLNSSEELLYLVEVSKNRVLEIDLLTPGKTNVFYEGFLGVPDDVFVDESDQVWVSLVSPRDEIFDQYLAPRHLLRRLVARLPSKWLGGIGLSAEGGSVVKLSPDGEVGCQYMITPNTAVANLLVKDRQLYIAVLAGDSPLRATLSNECI